MGPPPQYVPRQGPGDVSRKRAAASNATPPAKRPDLPRTDHLTVELVHTMRLPVPDEILAGNAFGPIPIEEDTATTGFGELVVPCLLEPSPVLRRSIREIPVQAALVVRIKEHMLKIADSSLAPITVPPAKVARLDKETGERLSESDFPHRLYFSTVLDAPTPREGTDYRLWLPPPVRVAGVVIEAAMQLIESGHMRQTRHGQMLKLARGYPGVMGDGMWLALAVIPDGHQGMYLDNLEYLPSDESIRRGLPQPLNIEDMEGAEDAGPVEREDIRACRDRIEDLLTRRREGVWIPAEMYLRTKLENVLTMTLRPAACDARVWLPKELLSGATLFTAVKQGIRDKVFVQKTTHMGILITLVEGGMQP